MKCPRSDDGKRCCPSPRTLTGELGLRPSHLETATWLVGSPGNGHPGPQWPHTPETAMPGGGGAGNRHSTDLC